MVRNLQLKKPNHYRRHCRINLFTTTDYFDMAASYQFDSKQTSFNVIDGTRQNVSEGRSPKLPRFIERIAFRRDVFALA